ncbi:hypothetical protein N7462_005707 [Penicillium macrosclerotiorum]|uniref:uncharacterized protein n=1 Tax=Penicillium macrosclerotiorum TaxID=303699 RepID=UPI002546F971|nr:uncharacterized protein N7462_005707 [Penicillium macrosclerotiorum]KAJ5682542.1 hypothetical protein N7462_005707 [Penicillium macrosclerotiorum]
MLVSVLVPVSPASSQGDQDEYENSQDQGSFDTDVDSRSSHRNNHYGEILRHSQSESTQYNSQGSEPELYTTPMLKLPPGHHISFLSYRISFPFLKSAPIALPQYPLPGNLMTVMVLLALVWIAILTIALVEFGNYLWKRRRAAMLAIESDKIANQRHISNPLGETAKTRLLIIPVSEHVRLQTRVGHDDTVFLSTNPELDSESDTESEVDES